MKSESIPKGAIKTFPWNKVPGGWRFELLGGVASIRRGASPRPAGDPRYFGGTIPWFRIGDATRCGSRFISATEQFVNEDGAKCSVRIPPGSLIVANSGVSLGFAVISEIEGCIHDGWLLLDNFRDADRDFLYYCINHFTPRIRNMADGTTQPNLNTDIARKLLVPLPSLSEQQAIASVLSSLDDKIELNRRINQTLVELAQTIFKSWFVDATATKIPKGWRFTKIAELCEINSWTLNKNDALDRVEYVEISEVMRGNIGNIQPYDRGEEPSRARRRLRHGDTILSTVRPDRGAYFLCLNPSPNLIASTGFAVLTPTIAPWSFIHAAMTQTVTFEFLGQHADGGAYPAVSPEIIGALEMPWPDKPEILEKFHRVCAPIYERAEQNRRESRTLAELRDALLPKLLSGELRVPIK